MSAITERVERPIGRTLEASVTTFSCAFAKRGENLKPHRAAIVRAAWADRKTPAT